MLWRRLTLSGRLIAASGAVLLLFVPVYLYALIADEAAFHRDALARELSEEMDFLVPYLAEAAVIGDYSRIREMLEVRARQPEIAVIRWTDSRGNRIDAAPDASLPEAPAWFRRWVALRGPAASREIVVGGTSYGDVYLKASPAPAEDVLWVQLVERVGKLLLGVVILFAAIALVASRGVRPLRVLGAVAQRFGGGEHGLRVKPAGPPEMVACATAFNVMAENIERLVGSLHESMARNRLLATAVEQASVAIITEDGDGRISSCNAAAAALLGYAAEDMLGRTATLLEPAAQPQQPAASPSGWSEAELLSRDGARIVVSTSVSPLIDDTGQPVGRIRVMRDITAQKHAAEALFQEQERAQVTLASIADAVITTDTEGCVEYLNPVAERLTGWNLAEARGRDLPAVFHAVDETTLERAASPVTAVLRDGTSSGVRVGSVLVSRQEQRIHVEDSAAPVRNQDGRVIGAVVVFRDVSESRKLAHQLSWQASHDPLTGLVNRREFERRLEGLVEAARHESRQHALCLADLDQFKVVNDTCGHVAGDELLRQLTIHMQGAVRASDTLARLGGDEFAALLLDCPMNQALKVAEKLRGVIAEFRFAWENKSFAVGASIGVAPIDRESQGGPALLAAADAACYAAKGKGRNRVQAWAPDDAELAARRGEMQWVSRLTRALEEDRFRLYAQKIVPVLPEASEPAHYELLVRMEDESGRLVAPMAFIPAAERYNLMPAIDRKVIALAFRFHHERWGGVAEGVCPTFSINLSGASLGDDRMVESIRAQLERYRLPPASICFEITETSAVANLGEASRMLAAVRELGCRFSLDDFGSGFSSFSYLKTLPVDFLKIDGAFVRDMAHDSIDAAMVGAINSIGHVMGIRTIAECVEDPAILELLRGIGVDYAQGYGIARPVPLEDIEPASA